MCLVDIPGRLPTGAQADVTSTMNTAFDRSRRTQHAAGLSRSSFRVLLAPTDRAKAWHQFRRKSKEIPQLVHADSSNINVYYVIHVSSLVGGAHTRNILCCLRFLPCLFVAVASFRLSETAKTLFLRDAPDLIASGNSRWTNWFGDDQTASPFDVSCFCSDTC